MSDIRWSFFGYVTPAGNPDVQEWYDGREEDAKDAILDVLAYLQAAPISLWRKPEFEHLGEGLSEVRAKAHVLKRIYRIYGFFWPQGRRQVYTFLLGRDKKVKNAASDIREARKRMGRITSGEATVHDFKFTQ